MKHVFMQITTVSPAAAMGQSDDRNTYDHYTQINDDMTRQEFINKIDDIFRPYKDAQNFNEQIEKMKKEYERNPYMNARFEFSDSTDYLLIVPPYFNK